MPNDTTLPNGHAAQIFGSASHEPGTSHQSEGHLPGSSTANGGCSTALAVGSTSLHNGTDWDDDDIMETHLAGGGLDGRDSANLLTVSLTSAKSPLGCESGLQNPPSEQLETASLSASVRHHIADEVLRSSRRDRQRDRWRDDPQSVFDLSRGCWGGGFNPHWLKMTPTLVTENCLGGVGFEPPSPGPASQFANYLCCFSLQHQFVAKICE